MNNNKNKEIIDELLTRGVGEFIDPDGAFRKKLEESPENIIIKFGIDPTRPDIHLGHAVVLRKLRHFQDLGCKVIFLIGDYTGQIGDPTGKSKVRPEIHIEEIQTNMKTYLDQIDKILLKDEKVFDWTINSDWFTAINDIGAPIGQMLSWVSPNGIKVDDIDANSTMGKSLIFENTRRQTRQNKNILAVTLGTFLWSLKHITHSRLIARDMFQDRIKKGEELYLHEMMYPVLQGIDSFAISKIYGNCDLEVGGTDQTFNMLIGRDIMKINNQTPQAVLAFTLLEGLDGKEKMSKSLDNYIGINEEPNEIFGKTMSIPDELIIKYFYLCTDIEKSIIEGYEQDMINDKVNPRDLKMTLGKEIVSMYHSKELAEGAQANFIATFQNKEIPSDLPEIVIREGALLLDVFVDNNIVTSKTDFRRLVDENAITNLDTNEKISDYKQIAVEGVYRVGKKRFCRIVTNK